MGTQAHRLPEAAVSDVLPDVLEPNMRLVICGSAAGTVSARAGAYYANPQNRFWRTLHAAGFTDRVLTPWDDAAMLEAGLGITNLVNRTTAAAAELAPEELRAGAARLVETTTRYHPGVVAVLGVSAYRTALDRPKAVVGPQQQSIGPSRAWVLPNPSGLNAHYQLPDLAVVFGELRAALED